MRMASQWTGQEPLAQTDPEIKSIIQNEKQRQKLGLELIASEVTYYVYPHSPRMVAPMAMESDNNVFYCCVK